MLWGSHTIKMWSRTQALVSLSSAEAELYAAIKACSETLGFLSLLKDYQVYANGKVMSDASAALGIIKRQGLGRTRHIHTSYLWIQHFNERGINFSKVPGSENCAHEKVQSTCQNWLEWNFPRDTTKSPSPSTS